MGVKVLEDEKVPMLSRLRVVPVRALEDNYMYLVWEKGGRRAFAIDPVEPAKLLQRAKEDDLTVEAALVTHHHWDHAGGNEELKKLLPSVKIFGGDERIVPMDTNVHHNEELYVAGITVRCLSTPCHTRGHICYMASLHREHVVFTGDTLFVAGCGKFFEGDGEQMNDNLNKTLSSLDDSTLVFPGHEYTTSNLKFAAHVEPNNEAIAKKLKWSRAQDTAGEPTVPSSIGDEKQTNPFMRVAIPEVQSYAGVSDAVRVMSNLRDSKNSFKPNSDQDMGDISSAQAAVLVPSDEIPEGVPEVRGFDFNEPATLDGLLESYATTAFQATHLAKAIQQINLALVERENETEEEFVFPYPEGRKRRPLTFFLGYTSNLVSSGLREMIRYCVEHDLVDCLVTTAGGVEEDLVKCLKPSFLGSFNMDGASLRKRGLNRTGNILVPNVNYCAFEDWLNPILDKCLEEQRNGFLWTPSKLIRRLGLEMNDKSSILHWAAVHSIPIFSPALTDGSLGDMLYFHSVKNEGGLRLDIVEDLRHINTMAVKSLRTAVLILGGGLVKHHINNANLMRNGSDYSVYVNTGQEFDGSDSGASPDEAVSWGKIKPSSSSVKVCADATLVFPLLMSQTFAKRGNAKKESSKEKL